MADAVGVIADQRPIPGKNRVAFAYSYEDAAHAQHPPRPIEDVLHSSFAMNHPGVELVQHLVHFRHPREELFVGDEISIEAL